MSSFIYTLCILLEVLLIMLTPVRSGGRYGYSSLHWGGGGGVRANCARALNIQVFKIRYFFLNHYMIYVVDMYI